MQEKRGIKKSRQALIHTSACCRRQTQDAAVRDSKPWGVEASAGTHGEQDGICSVLGASTTHTRTCSRDTVGSGIPCPGVTTIPASLVPRPRSSLNQLFPGLSPGFGEGKATNGFCRACEGENKPRECQENGSFSPTWYFLLLSAARDEVLNQRSALGISCSWETLGARGGGSTAPPAAPALRVKGSDPLGKVSRAGGGFGIRGLTKWLGGRT